MSMLQNKKKTLLACVLLTLSAPSLAGNSLEILADIVSLGECDISVSPTNVEFTQQAVVGDFQQNDAVNVAPIKLDYQCREYETTAMPEIKVTGSVSEDPNVFLTEDPTGAKGTGFMLKDGSVSELLGFYSKGTTLKNNDSFFLPAGNLSGTRDLTVGFVRQSGNNTVTAGNVKASILLTVVMP